MISSVNNQQNFSGLAIKSNAIKGKGKPNYTAVKDSQVHLVDYFEKGGSDLKTKILNYDDDVENQLAGIENFDKGIVLNVINKFTDGSRKLFVSAVEAFENANERIVTVKTQPAKMIDGDKIAPIKSEFSSAEGEGIKQLVTFVPDNKIAKNPKPYQAKKAFEENYHSKPKSNKQKTVLDRTPEGRWAKVDNKSGL